MHLHLALLVSLVACSSPPDGQQLFADKGCNACHSLDGSTRIAPTLKAAFGTRVELASGEQVMFDDGYFIESVFAPDAKLHVGYVPGMQPSFKGQIDDREMRQLIAFVKSAK